MIIRVQSYEKAKTIQNNRLFLFAIYHKYRQISRIKSETGKKSKLRVMKLELRNIFLALPSFTFSPLYFFLPLRMILGTQLAFVELQFAFRQSQVAFVDTQLAAEANCMVMNKI